jgi:hypothetical protein
MARSRPCHQLSAAALVKQVSGYCMACSRTVGAGAFLPYEDCSVGRCDRAGHREGRSEGIVDSRASVRRYRKVTTCAQFHKECPFGVNGSPGGRVVHAFNCLEQLVVGPAFDRQCSLANLGKENRRVHGVHDLWAQTQAVKGSLGHDDGIDLPGLLKAGFDISP